MLHEYRKAAKIEAEQFGGFKEQMTRYHIIPDVDAYGRTVYFLETLEGMEILHRDDWIATGLDGEHWVIANDFFQRTYERCD